MKSREQIQTMIKGLKEDKNTIDDERAKEALDLVINWLEWTLK